MKIKDIIRLLEQDGWFLLRRAVAIGNTNIL